jgi:hypothetical protein
MSKEVNPEKNMGRKGTDGLNKPGYKTQAGSNAALLGCTLVQLAFVVPNGTVCLLRQKLPNHGYQNRER